MINGVESRTQNLDSSSDTVELRHGQAQSMDSQLNQFSTGEVTHQSVNERINKLRGYVLYWQIGPIWTPLETAKLPVHCVKTWPLAQRTTDTPTIR